MKTIYWSSTLLLSAFLLLSAWSYVFHKDTIEGVRELGFPDFFRIQLVVLKVLAVAVLLAPQISIQIKEWAYAGVALFLLTAIVAHIAHKDPIFISLISVVMFAVLVASNIYLHKVSSL